MNTLARNAVALAAAVSGLSGCFTYVTTELAAVPEGGDVRVYLTRRALAELPEEIPADRPFLSGALVRHEDDSLMLRVPVGSRREGFHTAQIRQDVRVPTGEILELQRRELNGAGTGLLVAGTAGAATAVILMMIEAYGSQAPDSGEVPDVIRIPVFFLAMP